jgi:hypothetical protein
MMRNWLAVGLLVLVLAGQNALAVTRTNMGQVVTVTLASETADAGTVTKNQSVEATPTDRRGLIVAHYTVTATDTGTVYITDWNVPKGAILLEDGVMEVYTAITGTNSANTITVGGVTIKAAGTELHSTGIKSVVPSPVITTSAGRIALVIADVKPAVGEFTLYLPYILGNASR